MDPMFVNEAYTDFDDCIDIIDSYDARIKNSLIFVEKFNHNDLQRDPFMEAMIFHKEYKHLRGNLFCETMHIDSEIENRI